MVPETGRTWLRRAVIVGAIVFGLCLITLLTCGLYFFWDSTKLINFLAAWIPFTLSVLFAFVPSAKEMKHGWIKWTWRSVVMVVGLSWSVMLWHQQGLSDSANKAQIADAVTQAIAQANSHSDIKFAEMGTWVHDLGTKVGHTQEALVQQLGKAESDLTSDIGRVNKPESPPPAKLTFSLWAPDASLDHPAMTQYLLPDSNGDFPIDFTFGNGSGVSAKAIDIWVQICDGCSFAKEPNGFEHPAGTDNRVRHRHIGDLNPGVSFAKMTLLVKAPRARNFQIEFRYSCENCGGKISKNQIVTITEGIDEPVFKLRTMRQ